MKIKHYHWICKNCHKKVDVLKQIAECFHPETGELCFGIVQEEDLIYCMITCPNCGTKWELNITGVNKIERK